MENLYKSNTLKLFVILLISFVFWSGTSNVARGQTSEVWTIWDNTAIPSIESESDPNAIEVGVKFQANTAGVVTGIRFYKGSSNIGTHIGNLWSNSGQLLASATFVNETASGWQQVNFGTPVQINPNTTYVASYHTEVGYYSVDNGYFSTTDVVNGPLRALAGGVSGGNGVFVYGSSAYPTQTYNSANYWVDVVFETGPDTMAPVVTGVFPLQAASNVFPDSNLTVTFNEAIDPATINETTFQLRDAANNLVPAIVSFNALNKTATLDPVNSLSISAFSATIKGGSTDPVVKDIAGNSLSSDYSWSFSTSTCDSVNNEIVCENAKPGNPASEWDIVGAGDLSIQGFATDISVNQGQTVHFKIDTDASDYVLDIYRMGFYNGQGARKVATVQPSVTLPQNQPACLEDTTTGLIDCGNWSESASWAVPVDAVSGIYFAKVTRTDTGGASHIVFVVRDDDGGSDLLFQTSDTTWQSYNTYGGNSFYVGAPAGRAYKISYNRPFSTREVYPEDWVFNAEYPMVRWLEANGYDVSYFTGVDSDRFGQEILEHQGFLSVGHDEYWSADQRTNVEAARDAGVNLAFFSGNEIFWKTRWENSIDGTGTAYRTLVSYKETHDNAKSDPLQNVWTGTWRDPRFSPPADGGKPENALTGTLFKVNIGTYPIKVPEADGKMRFWRNTSVATLGSGEVATLSDFTLGYEWDESPDNGFQPAGLFRLSTTNVTDAEVLQDYGSTYATGPATHNLTLYRHNSGALVFGAGTVQWSWGLDGNHDRLSSTPDVRMQQATVNLFADMGIQPATLQSDLIAAIQTTDVTAPTSIITSPVNGSTIPINTTITINGTASDVGGAVGGVEVSVDGGVTWHPTTGRQNWSFAWTPTAAGSVSLLSRAVDDSGNLETGSGISVFVSDQPDTESPTVSMVSPTGNETVTGTISIEASATDNFGVIGVQFKVDGVNLGLENTAAPYLVSWNTVTSVNGSHSITAVARDAAGNTTTSTAVVVTVNNPVDTTAPVVASTTPSNNATNVSLDTIVSAVFSEPMDPATINGNTIELRDAANNVVLAPVTYDVATQTVSLTPVNPLVDGTTYMVTIQGGATDPRVKDISGNALLADYTWSFVAGTSPNQTCPCSIWNASTVPVNDTENDGSAVELGVKFQTDVDGYITGIRFYKGSQNTGTHIGNLWTNDGQLIGSATFTNETGSGWQEVVFAAPVAVSANVTYVASYHTEVGYYAQDGNYFSTGGVNNAPLRALADGEDGNNGVYQYGDTAFPAQYSSGANYWVDVVFAPSTGPDVTAPVVINVTPADGAVLVSPIANITAVFNEPINAATLTGSTFELRDSSSNIVPAVVSYDSASRRASLNPIDNLQYATTYTATLRSGTLGVTDTSGNALPNDKTWSFTTVNAPPVPPNEGPGGPILVIGSATNPFGRYYTEILRAEGLNLFLSTDISMVTPSTLNGYDVVILGEMPLTSGQVTMLSDWVNTGGNLIAMRPDKQLASLLGITDASATVSNAYIQVDTSTQPGFGIVNETIQYHGQADLYNLAGANAIATLYADATTPTQGNAPAVTINNVGGNGGQAAAFTYDLARSIVYTRQGNPAWEGQDRDGLQPARSNDMFYGNAAGDPQADWVDLNKVAIPQADEQQRLLVNLILQMNADQKPLPRFWYFPNDFKAVVVMTGDDHGIGLTQAHFDAFSNMSTPGCSVNDWECIRGTSYIYPVNPMSPSAAAAYVTNGFEVALHVDSGCAAYSELSLDANFSNQLAQFLSTYTSIPAPVTNRTHCIVWSDWATQAVIENQYGIRLDTNYYYFPESWVNGRDGFFTGSGMPMRFADLDGKIIDVYQATTQMTDESGQIYPATANILLDRAIGPEGYYGAFTTNMHTDRAVNNAVAIVQSAQARGVPVITARQMLEWLDGRNTSSFGSLSWDGSTLSFSISADPGANNLRAMLPIQTEAGAITSINFNGTPITFSTEIIKGIEYAVFDALTGVYQASTTPLPPDTEAPSVTITEPVASAVVSGTVTIRANASDNVAVAGVQFQVDGVNVGAEDTIAPYSINWNSLTVANGTHQLTAIARDAVGNTATASAIPVTVNNIPDTVSPTVISISPVNGQANVPVNSSISVSFSEAMDSATINGTTVQLRDSNNNLVSAAVSYNVSAKTATLTPSSALATATTYSIVVRGGAADPRVKDLAGNALSADFTSSFSTAVPSPYSSIWDGSVTPARASENDPNPVELGVKFQSDIDGYITGIRFYKGGSNTGSHIGNLWDMSGQLLATATFVNETASGWQQVNFATPVAVNANTTYVASYHTEAGYYAVDSNYFSVNGVNNAPLRALANGVEGGNGVYEYGPTQFPSSSFSASNYWVDVVFATEIIPDTESPVVNITNPIDGATIAGAVNINASVTDNVGVVGVQFTLDGVNLGQEDASAPYSVDWNSLSATNGNHQIAAIARDAAGNTSTSAVINVTVDNLVDTTPPTITTMVPSNGAIDVALDASVTAVFSEGIDPATINTNTFELRDSLGNLITATVGYDGVSRTASLVPNSPLLNGMTYTATIGAGVTDLAGNALANDVSWTFTTLPGPEANCPCSIWDETTVPAVASVNDPSAVELGVKFQSDVAGYITGIRFYKGAANTGNHTGNLWGSNGQLLATASFVNESATGWQQVSFAAPVQISANTTYVASYHTTSGNYAAAGAYFAASGVDNAPLRALGNGIDGGNGVYKYGGTGFPSSSYNASNYWVDVVFDVNGTSDTTAPTVLVTAPVEGAVINGTVSVTAVSSDNVGVAGVQFMLDGANLGVEDSTVPYAVSWDTLSTTNGAHTLTAVARDFAGNTTTSSSVNVTVNNQIDTTPPTVVSVTPLSGATNVAPDANITVTFSEAMNATSVQASTISLRDAANSLVAAAVSYDAASQTATLTPNSPLANGVLYTATVSQVTDVAGNVLANDYVWSFTTEANANDGCPCSIWDASATPSIPSANDPSAIEVGVKFQSDTAGFISGIRFYKGDLNTGSHIGNLWSSSGQLLATANFVNETATGWQQVDFATPVQIQANTTYVASYHTSSGGYAVDPTYFASGGVDNLPLQALGNGIDGGNGVYKYGGTGFPAASYNASNYWVDVVFTTTGTSDTTPPTVAITNPADGASINNIVTVAADASDNVGVIGVQFVLDGANLGAEDIAAPYSVSWDSTSVNNGTHTLTAVAQDAAGNTTTSTEIVITVSNDVTPPTILSVTPSDAAVDVALDASVTAVFNEGIDPATVNTNTFELRDATGTLIAATVSYDGVSQAANLVPNSPLLNGMTYTATVGIGVTDLSGNALANDVSWTFTTLPEPETNCPCSIWDETSVPVTASVNDPSAIELGVKFQSDVSGYITGIRFYKGTNNTGTHIGNLWDSSGQQLATATFISETGSGWQQVNFATPVAINANTTYVASYHTEVGYYAANGGYFSFSGVDNAPLRALGNGVDGGNGVYRYGATGFPSSSYNATNYWVDVVFATTP